MGSVDSRPKRNGHRTSTSRWDIAGLGAGEGSGAGPMTGAVGGSFTCAGSSSVRGWRPSIWTRGGGCGTGPVLWGRGAVERGLHLLLVLLGSSTQVVAGAPEEEAAPRRDAPVLVGTRGPACKGRAWAGVPLSPPACAPIPGASASELALAGRDRGPLLGQKGVCSGPADELHRHGSLERSIFNWTGPSFMFSYVSLF